MNGERGAVNDERLTLTFNEERLMGRGRRPSLDMWKRMMGRTYPHLFSR